ncbi:class IV adenylate cyclase [Salinarchaeum chitinilyticum]
MYEVEVKVEADHDAIRERLPAEAEPLGTVEQVDTYYDAPHRDFAETDEALRLRRERRVDADPDDRDASPDGKRKPGKREEASPESETASAESEKTIAEGERTAAEGERTISADEWTTAVTYKGPLLEAASKSREEFETVVAEGAELAAAFDRLGFEPAAEVRKERQRYALGEFTISLDAVDGLGEFLEVETEIPEDAGEGSIAEPREAARALLADLGCDPEEQIRTSYLGLLLAEND